MRDPTGSAVKSAVAAHTWEIKRCGINQTWPSTQTHAHTERHTHGDTQATSNIVTMKSNQALARPARSPSATLMPQLCSATNCGHTKSWPKAKTTARQAPPLHPHLPKTPKAPIQNCCLILLRKSRTHAPLQLVTGHTLNRRSWSVAWSALSSLWGPICGPSSSAKFPISEMFNGPANGNGKRPAATVAAAAETAEATEAKRGTQLSWIFPATICANLLA